MLQVSNPDTSNTEGGVAETRPLLQSVTKNKGTDTNSTSIIKTMILPIISDKQSHICLRSRREIPTLPPMDYAGISGLDISVCIRDDDRI